MAAPNFSPTSHPIDPTALIGPAQNKALAEYQAQQAKNARRQAMVKDILQAVEQGQTIASNAMKLADDRRRRQGIGELTSALTAPDSQVTRAVPASGPVSETGQRPMAMQQTTLSQTPEGQASAKARLLAAATKVAPDKAAASIVANQFPKPMTGSATRATPMGLELPDGTQALGFFDPLTNKYKMQDGTEAPSGTKRSYKMDFRADSEGNIMPLSGSAGTQVKPTINTAGNAPTTAQSGSVTNVAQLPVETRKEVVKALNTSQSDPVIKKEKEIYVGMTRLEKAVNSGNQAIVQKLGLVFQRALGDTGNIAIAEQKSPGSSKLIEQAKQVWDTYISTGQLTPENKKIVLDAARTLRDVSYDNYNTAVDIEADQLTSTYPQLNRDYIRNSIGGTLTQIPKPSTTTDELKDDNAGPERNTARLKEIDDRIQQIKALINSRGKKK